MLAFISSSFCVFLSESSIIYAKCHPRNTVGNDRRNHCMMNSARHHHAPVMKEHLLNGGSASWKPSSERSPENRVALRGGLNRSSQVLRKVEQKHIFVMIYPANRAFNPDMTRGEGRQRGCDSKECESGIQRSLSQHRCNR
ncbi:hypothetical protein BDN67DRAFT_976717 [Paxillus ammoniavirescens]|nr:hypothetical protein BDN67DRAFT_976717 [Paxillus ammoniavirescens]